MSSVNIPTGFAQLAWHFSGPIVGRDMVTTLGVSVPTSWTPTTSDLTTIANAMANANHPLPLLQSSTTLTKVRAYVGQTGGVPGMYEKADGRAGTGAGSVFPPALCWRITKTTAQPGRTGRGRMFLPGLLESNANDAGVMLNTAITSMDTALTNLVSTLATISLIPFLLHSQVGTTPNAITGLTCAGTVGLQKRRLGR
jgi:hypothetical protein